MEKRSDKRFPGFLDSFAAGRSVALGPCLSLPVWRAAQGPELTKLLMTGFPEQENL